MRLAADVRSVAEAAALEATAAHHAGHPDDPGPRDSAVRAAVALSVRRAATVSADAAGLVAASIVDELVQAGRLVRDEDRVGLPDHRPARPDPRLLAAMERLEAALAVPAPPPLATAAGAAGCPPAGIRELVRQGRIVVLQPGLAYAMSAYRDLAATALALSAVAPLTPAAFRDATGTSRKYVMPILEDLDRRGVLRRTPAGHLPGPRASAGAG
jgi:selenocysteine-specific elongation factor